MKTSLFNYVIISLLFLTSCATDIQEIKNNPDNYKNKTVTVKGKVNTVINVLLKKGFFIEDKTGEIFVMTDNALPKKGEQKMIEGKVIESPELLGNSMILIQENTK